MAVLFDEVLAYAGVWRLHGVRSACECPRPRLDPSCLQTLRKCSWAQACVRVQDLFSRYAELSGCLVHAVPYTEILAAQQADPIVSCTIGGCPTTVRAGWTTKAACWELSGGSRERSYC
jgi:hypothetical protein